MSSNVTDPRAGWNEVAAEYDRTRALPGDGERETPAALVDVFQRLGSTHILEVGVGTGRMAVPVATAGLRITGLDQSWPMLDGLRAKSPPSALGLVYGDAFALPFAEDTFDALLCSHFLHLLPDLPAFAAHVAPVLRPGAHVVVIDTAFSKRDVMERVLAAVFPHIGLDFVPWPTGERSKDRNCFEEFVSALGGEAIDLIPVGEYEQTVTHRQYLADIRGRHAWTFRQHDQATIDAAVDAAESELAAGHDLEAELAEVRGVRLLIGRLPGSTRLEPGDTLPPVVARKR